MSRGQNQGYPPVAEYLPDEVEHRRLLAVRSNQLSAGNFNCSLDVTLNASATSTTLTDPRIFPTKTVVPMALTASAKTAIVAGFYYDTFLKGSCVVHHASNAATDQTVRFAIFG